MGNTNIKYAKVPTSIRNKFNGLPTIHHKIERTVNNVKESEMWYYNKKFSKVCHNTGDEPAYITYWVDGVVQTELWFRHGKISRLNGPAEKEYSSAGLLLRERWYFAGTFGNLLDFPSVIDYSSNGFTLNEIWYTNGKINRERLPAVKEYHPKTGKLVTESWYTDGKLIKKVSHS